MPHFFEQYRQSEVTETHRVIHTPSDTAKRAFLYIQEAGYLKSLKPHLGKRAGLDSYLFLIVLSGSGTITYKDIAYSVCAQDCFLLDCHEAYSHISAEHDPWELLWLHFNGEQASQLYQYVIQKNGHCFRVNTLPTLTDAVSELITLNSDISEYSDITSSYLITQILTISVTDCQKPGNIQTGIKEKLYQILTYMNEHFNENISLTTLSGQFYISKYHLAREFKKEYNQTIVQYLLNKRITCAKELLRFTDMNIGEIALRCGIKDLNYFNKVFRKIEGCTASEYRKRW
jgi:AraC-like DNA-binding protein